MMKISPMIAIENQIKLDSQTDPMSKMGDKEELRNDQLRKKSNELEAVFLTQLIKSMEKTIPEGIGGGKNSLSTMMFSSVLGDAMSNGGGIGLSKMIFESLKKMDGAPELSEIGTDGYLQSMDIMQNMDFGGDSE